MVWQQDHVQQDHALAATLHASQTQPDTATYVSLLLVTGVLAPILEETGKLRNDGLIHCVTSTLLCWKRVQHVVVACVRCVVHNECRRNVFLALRV